MKGSSRRFWIWNNHYTLFRGADRRDSIKKDEGRIAPMRKTARAIRSYNPIQSKYSYGFMNQPITNMIEDILEKIHRNHTLYKIDKNGYVIKNGVKTKDFWDK